MHEIGSTSLRPGSPIIAKVARPRYEWYRSFKVRGDSNLWFEGTLYLVDILASYRILLFCAASAQVEIDDLILDLLIYHYQGSAPVSDSVLETSYEKLQYTSSDAETQKQ